MSLNPNCNKCGNELTDYGAILLSPPDVKGMVKKFHICQACYEEIAADLK